jgi:hypothetical protein
MSEDLATRLRALSHEVCNTLFAAAATQCLSTPEFVDYHGFQKSTLRSPQILALVEQCGFRPEEVQIELVRLNRPLPQEAHYHEATHAHVMVLGAPIFRNPEQASVYVGSQWSPAHDGMSLDIPPRIVHGFSVRSEAGVLDFLSVQSPPLLQGDHDDFIVMEVPAP